MNKLACARNLFILTCATLGLAACGSSSSSGSAAAASSTGSSVSVQTNTGMINRSGGSTVASTTQSVASGTTATTVASTSPSTTTPVSTVGSTNKTTTPVKSATTGVATLDWTPPTENSDGTPLTNLAGYVVYYGSSPSALTQTIKVTNAGLTAYSVTDLPAGTWYFQVSSISADGVESDRSATVSTAI